MPMLSLYLSRLHLNPWSAAVRRDLLDAYQCHRTLCRAFDAGRSAAGLLYRVEGDGAEPLLLAQSLLPPDWCCLPEEYLAGENDTQSVEVKTWVPHFAEGAQLRFRLRANPTFKRGKRRLAWLQPDDHLAWLERQASRRGFSVMAAQAEAEGFSRSSRGFSCHGVLFDGVLGVTDPRVFGEALTQGIGSAKAFGYGLLSLAPA